MGWIVYEDDNACPKPYAIDEVVEEQIRSLIPSTFP
jgi:hypothetical protein